MIAGINVEKLIPSFGISRGDLNIGSPDLGTKPRTRTSGTMKNALVYLSISAVVIAGIALVRFKR